VCLDVVYNHLGSTGNYLAEFGPYFTDRYSTPWGPAVNLDGPGSAVVRRWVVDNALRWFREFHVDALRLDAVHALRDESDRHILAQLSDETASLVAELGRPLELVAESDLNDPIVVSPTAQGGRGMTAQWDDDIHHALHVALTGETQGYYTDFAGGTVAWPDGGPLSVLAKTLSEVFLHDGRMSTFRGQVWGGWVDPSSTSGHRFVAYLQTHDQVGNRARGDRINATVGAGLHAVGAAIYLLSPYTAMLFMGEEWRASTPFAFFTSFEEDWLAEAVRRGRRAEFAAHGWAEQDVPDPQDPSTRDGSVLVWDEVDTAGHRETLAFYRRLIEIRRTEPAVADGDLSRLETRLDEEARWFVMSRGPVQVVANLAADTQVVPVPDGYDDLLVSWGPGPERVPGGLRLAGHDVAVVRRRP
jgi:maltooligosyltrehalose trehalohydrolase